jgi:peptidoglycan/LPS O-acetylase OafA/YrhL
MADIETADPVPAPTGSPTSTEAAAVAPAPALGGNGNGNGIGGGADDGKGGGGGSGGSGSSGDGTTAGGSPARTSSKLAYNPALDGIRGIAVGVVLLFHGGYSWARGGYLGVSTFFTLSGFLITSLLIAERADKGKVRLTAFWARRLRRLFPASALCLAALSLSAIVTNEGWERDLQGDVLSALFQVANWHFLIGDRSYAALFATPSPVLHFWSLAIEEQFYWVFPLLTAGVFGLAKGSLKVFAGVLGGLLALSAALTLFYGTDESTVVYYATPIRMGEILVGSLLAVLVYRGLPGGDLVKRVAAAAGVVALAVSAFCWWNVGQDSPKVYEGGLLVYAVVSAVLILSATVPGPMRTALAVEPLRLLGVISYGVYLFHWPIFLILNPERTGVGGEKLFALRIAVTLAVAIASYNLLEKPIRRGWTPKLPFSLPMPALAGATFVAVAVIAVIVPRVSPPPRDPFEDSITIEPADDPDPSTIPAGASMGLSIGDSTLFRTNWGLSVFGDETDAFNTIGGAGGMGCGITRGGEIDYSGNVGSTRPECDDWEDRLPRRIAEGRDKYGHIDFALVQFGPWDVSNRRLEGSDEWIAPGDPEYDDYLRSEIETMVDLLLDDGVYVVWLTAPHLDVGRMQEPPPERPYPESDPARIDRFNEIVREVVNEREGAVALELGEFLRQQPGGEMDATYEATDGSEQLIRPDGVHFEIDSATYLARNGLGDEFLRALEAEALPAGSDWDRDAWRRDVADPLINGETTTTTGG